MLRPKFSSFCNKPLKNIIKNNNKHVYEKDNLDMFDFTHIRKLQSENVLSH